MDYEVGPKFTRDTWSSVKGGPQGRAPLRFVPAANSEAVLPMRQTSSSSSMRPIVIEKEKEIAATYGKNRPWFKRESSVSSDDDMSFPQGSDMPTKHIEEQMEAMSITGFGKRFYGKSSGVILTQSVMHMKEEVMGSTHNSWPAMYRSRPLFFQPGSVSLVHSNFHPNY